MDRKPAVFTRYQGVWQTTMANERADKAVKLGEAIKYDSGREGRIVACQCKACFYTKAVYGRMAGAAVTRQPCACCIVLQTYGSTSTDALCMACAREHSLCKHCGGDLEMRAGRRKWPADNPRPNVAPEQQK